MIPENSETFLGIDLSTQKVIFCFIATIISRTLPYSDFLPFVGQKTLEKHFLKKCETNLPFSFSCGRSILIFNSFINLVKDMIVLKE